MSTCLHVKRFRLIHLPSTLFLIAFHSYLEFELPGQPAARDSWSQSVMPIICPQSPRQQTFPLSLESTDRRFTAVTSFNNSDGGNRQQFRV